MVAKTIELPNLRKMFIPDPGYTMAEGDLAQADAQVVAWEANDDLLKQIFREKLDLHTENAKMIFGKTHINYSERQRAKVGVHAVDYGVRARTLASELGITVKEADDFIKNWFKLHPGIEDWHRRIESQLYATKTIENAFGFKRFYMNRVRGLLPKALAWIPQSTVAIVTYKGMLAINKFYPDIQLLLQIHDSILMQIPNEMCPDVYKDIIKLMEVVVPYEDPLTIPVSIKVSEKSWGDIVNPFEELAA